MDSLGLTHSDSEASPTGHLFERFPGELEKSFHLPSLHGGKTGQKFVDAAAVLEKVEKRLDRHARSVEDETLAVNLGVARGVCVSPWSYS